MRYLILVPVLLAAVCALMCGCSPRSAKKAELQQRREAARDFRREEAALDKEIEKNKEEARKEDAALAGELEAIPEVHIDTGYVTFEWAGDKGKSMSCRAARFSGSQNDKKVDLEGFSATLNDREARLAARMIARKATLFTEEKRVVASGGVKVTGSRNGAVLTADRVEWDSVKGKIYARNARLTTDMGTMTGSKMTLDTALETFEVSD